MFHAGGHKGVNTRGRSSALSRNYPHFLSHGEWKAPLRCGILFCTFSCILFVIGVIFTWLGTGRRVHDVFGESVPITGPILLSVGGLMLLLALRQFYMAHMRKRAHTKAIQNKEAGVTAITTIAEQDEEQEMVETEADPQKSSAKNAEDTIAITNEKQPFTSGDCYDPKIAGSSCEDMAHSGGYYWPPVPLQDPYYSMAMMVYKDPTLICSPYTSVHGYTDPISSGPVYAPVTNMGAYEVGNEAEAAAALSPHFKQDMAILKTPSTTLPQHLSLSSSSAADSGLRSESSKIFPADYLSPCPRSSNGSSSSANAGISNLPNPTAFMMIRTLELQETI